MKYLLLMLLVFAEGVFADCGMIDCFNPCTGQKISLKGDLCSLTWNDSLNCYEAYTECEGSKKCLGALCFDFCENRNHYFPKANSCKDIYDPAGMCWRSVGECK